MSALRFLLKIGKQQRFPLPVDLVLSPFMPFESAETGYLWCSAPDEVISLPDGHGVIIGRLFTRDTLSAVTEISATEAQRLVQSNGDALICDYWGPYLALLLRGVTGRYTLVRAPSGFLPCYHVETPTHDIWASDLHTLAATGSDVSGVDWERLYEHLQWPDVRRQRSCIEGVSELAPGSAYDMSPGVSRSQVLWNPWTFCHPDLALTSARSAPLLRDAVFSSVSALASGYGNIIVTMSGGLDSSIVSAALARGQHRFSGLTMATVDGSGDESRYASSVAAAAGVPLSTWYYAMEEVDLARSSAAHLPRPVGRAFLQELDRACASQVAGTGADALFTGNGGDNVFCFLHSAAPIVDRLRQEKRLTQAWDTLLDMCQVTQCDIPTMARATFDLVRARSPAPDAEPDQTLLDPARAGMTQSPPLTPYTQGWEGRIPGKAAHVRLLQRIQNYVEGNDRTVFPPSLPVLLAQPIVETCLRIPSWQWCEGGINRSVARRAFAGFLPRDIARRTSKSGPDSFTACVFEAGRARLRELLLDGLLRQNHIIDALAVERAMQPRPGNQYPLLYRILDLADAEAWARSRPTGNATAALG